MKKNFTLVMLTGMLLISIFSVAQTTYILTGGSLSGTLAPWDGIAYFYTPKFNVNATNGIDITYYDIDVSLITHNNFEAWGDPVIKGWAEPGISTNTTMGGCDPLNNSVWINLLNMNRSSGVDWYGNAISTIGPDGIANTDDDTRHQGTQDWYRPSTGGKVDGVSNCPYYNTESYVIPNPRFPTATPTAASELNKYDLRLRVLPIGGNQYTYEMWVRKHTSAAQIEGAYWVYNKAMNTVTDAWIAFPLNADGSGATVFTISNIDLSAVHVFMGLGNWYTEATHAITWGQIQVTGTYAAPSEVWVDDNYTSGGMNDGHWWGYDAFATVQDGVNAVATGGTVNVAAGTYTEGSPQVAISKNLSIVGADKLTTIIKPSASTTSCASNDDNSGWFLVNSGYAVNFSNLTFDGTSFTIGQGIRMKGPGVIDNCIFKDIKCSTYYGLAISIWDANATVSNCNFSNIGRVGIHVNGSLTTNAIVTGNTYVGKGVGDWLDYGVEVERGAKATITYNNVSDCLGVASDGSTSAGMYATTYFNPGTQATINDNTFSNNSDAIAVGYDASDAAIVTAYHNSFLGTGTTNGVTSTSSTITVDAEENYWGSILLTDVDNKASGLVDFDPWCNADFTICNYTEATSNGPITYAGKVVAPIGSVTVPITVTSFSNVTAISLIMHYNPAILTFTGFTPNSALGGLGANGSNGTVAIGWFGDAPGVSLADNDYIVNLNFNFIGGTSPLTWDDSNDGNCEYANEFLQPYIDDPTAYYYIDGWVTDLSVSFTRAYSPSPGTITAVPAGGTSPYSYAWTGPSGFIAGNTATITPTNGYGNYVVTVTDDLGATTTGTYYYGPVHNIDTYIDYALLNDAIDAAATLDGHTIAMDPGTYVEIGQIVVDKNLTIIGDSKTTTIIKPNAHHASTSNGWMYVAAGKTLNLSKVQLDGSGYNISNAIYQAGNGVINDCQFTQIMNPWSNPPVGPIYDGTAIRVVSTANIDITNCDFTQIGRNGIRAQHCTGTVSGNAYTGKGAGDWMDYFILAEYGCNILINGNTVTNCIGIALVDGSGSAAIAVWDDINTTAVITNNILTGNSTGIGIAGINSATLPWPWPAVTIGAGNVITGGEFGITMDVYSGYTCNPPVTFGTTTITGQTVAAISIGDAVSPGTNYDISSITLSTTDNCSKEDLVIHAIDAGNRALLVWNPNNVYVTVNSFVAPETAPSIQRGIDVVGATGWTVNVCPGTFPGNINLNKSVTLLGANMNIACGSRVPESTIAPVSGVPITVTANGTTINGFEITAPASNYAIVCGNTSDLSILFNYIHDIGTSLSSGNVHAVNYTVANGSNTSNVAINDNCFNNISTSALTGASASAIGVLQSTSTGILTGLSIKRNTISNVNVNTSAYPTGKGAYGIQVNVGATGGGQATSPVIEYNSIYDLEGQWAHAIGLEGNTPGAMVNNNLIYDLTDHKSPSDAVAVMIEDNSGTGITVTNNSFATTVSWGIAYEPVNVVSATCNWWGTADGDDVLSRIAAVAGTVTYSPWLVSGANSATGTGFVPSGACTGTPVVASAVSTPVYCGPTPGSILVIWTGGTPNYTVSWTGTSSGSAPGLASSPYTIAGLTAGSFTVTVTDANGSSSTVDPVVVQYLPVHNVTQNTYHATIQGAIDAGSTMNGDVIQICAGLYKENVLVNKGITLEGINRTGVIIAPTAEDTGNGWSKTDGSPQNGIKIESNNVTIKTLTVDGTANNLANGGTLPDHFNFRHGILLGDGVDYTGISVQNCDVKNILRRAILLYPTTGYTGVYSVTGCNVLNVQYQNAISIGSPFATITGNTLDNINNAISVHHSTDVAGATTTISNNVITNLGHIRDGETYPPTGIYYRNPNSDRTVIIQNNTVTAANNVAAVIGMYLYNMDASSLISGNVINLSTQTVIDPTIPSGGTYTGFAWSYPLGAYIGGSAGATLQNNTFSLYGIGSGIYTGRGSGTTPVPNIITGNILTTSSPTGTGFESYGIASSNDPTFDVIGEDQFNSNVTITNNYINGFHRGVLLHDVNEYTVDATINNNDLSGNTLFAIDASTLPNTVNATCNWYGIADGDLIDPMIAGPADYDPWLTDGTDDEGATPGFQPVPLSCNGFPIVIASALPDDIICGGTSGSITVTFTDGVAPISITWSGTASGSAFNITSPYTIPSLAVGSYTITLTDANGSSASAGPLNIQYLPVKNTTDNLFFATIQGAIDAATTGNGDVIDVCAGTYNETVLVNKELTLQGPNAAISPNTGTRVAEAIITGNIGATTAAIRISANNVTIKGFKITGITGTSAGRACIGGGHNFVNYTQPSNVRIEKMLIDGNDATGIYTNGHLIMDAWTITDNRIQNLTFSSASAINPWKQTNLTITDNVISNIPHNGINASDVNGGMISGNQVTNVGANGIQVAYNTSYTTSNLTITNNTITQANTSLTSDYGGIRLYGSASISGYVNITNNFVVNSYNGIAVKDGQALPAGVYNVTNNSITGNTNYDIYHGGTGTLAATCNWYGVICHPDLIPEIYYSGGTVTYSPWLVNGTDNSGDLGFQPVPGSCAEPLTIISAVPTNYYCGSTTGSITVTFTGGTGPYSISWAGPTPGSASGITSPYNIALLSAGDYSITVTDANLCSYVVASVILQYLPVTNVTPDPDTYWPTIQSAIDAATAGDEIHVCAGTYYENLSVTKGISLIGAGRNITFVKPATADYTLKIKGNAGMTGNVLVEGFTFEDTDHLYWCIVETDHIPSASTLTFQNNRITDCTEYAWWDYHSHGALLCQNNIFDHVWAGIQLEGWDTSPVTIQNNEFTALHYADGDPNYIPFAINPFTYGGLNCTNAYTISGNYIHDFSDGGAGIVFNGGYSGQTPANYTNVTINANTIANVGLEGIRLRNRPYSGIDSEDPLGGVNNASIVNNIISGCGIDVNIRGSNPGTQVHNNSLTAFTSYAISNNSTTSSVDGTCNWYGTADGDLIATYISGTVTYSPWLTGGTDGGDPGFVPTDPCNGSPIAITETHVNVTCNGGNDGSIDITVSGGVSPLTYLWSPGGQTTEDLTGLIAGTYTVTVTDANTSTGTITVTITEPAVISISGVLTYHNTANTPMNNVTIQLKQGASVIYTTTTLTNGSYSFSPVCPGTYDVVFTTVKPVGGINSTDAGLVNGWNVNQSGGIHPTIERVQFNAGDVTGDNSILSNDAQSIQIYFITLGATPFVPAWEFWKAGETVNAQNPAPTSLQITVTQASPPVTMNFYGMVSGDFNQSFTPGAARSVSNTLTLVDGQTIQAGPDMVIDLPVRIESGMEVGAISLIMNFPSDKLSVENVYLQDDPMLPIMYNVIDSELRIGWNSLTPLLLATGETMLTVKVKTAATLENGEILRFNLSSDPLNELADGAFNVIPEAVLAMDVIECTLVGINDPTKAGDLVLGSYPNPFNGITNIVYTIPEEGYINLEITGLLGDRLALMTDQRQMAGRHLLSFDGKTLPPGIYLVSLRLKSQSGDYMKTIRIVSQ